MLVCGEELAGRPGGQHSLPFYGQTYPNQIPKPESESKIQEQGGTGFGPDSSSFKLLYSRCMTTLSTAP